MTKPVQPKKLRSYLFSCGNSTVGPIGFCARVQATSRREALQLLKAGLPTDATVETAADAEGSIEYLNVYFNEDAVTVQDIEDVEDVNSEANDANGA